MKDKDIIIKAIRSKKHENESTYEHEKSLVINDIWNRLYQLRIEELQRIRTLLEQKE